jgi:hypothetical protein
MSNLREAAQQALEALEKADKISGYANNRAAITALRAALAEPVQEPVLLQCTTCGTVYAEGVPPQVPELGAYHGWVMHDVLFDNGEPIAHREPAAPTPYTEADCLAAEKRWSAPAAPTVVEPCGWACFKDGVMQTELVGTKADVDFWCASDEPHMQGMVAGPVFATPPRAALTDECLLLLDTAMDSLKYHQEQTRPIHLTEVTIQAIQEFLEKHQIGGPRNE